MAFSFGFSQDQLLGFETAETGGVDGTPFGNGPAPMVEAGTGSNTSQVLKIVGNPAGEPWQGINLNLTSPTNLTATQTMTMDVFSDVAITFLVKATGGVGGPGVVAAAVTHPGGSTWQTISFTFNTVLDGQGAPASGIYNKFVIHTYWVAGETTFFPGGSPIPRPVRTFYVDNIKGPLGVTPVITAPTNAAPTPPARPAADVKSIFSDAYAPIVFDNFDAGWCGGAATTLVQIANNNTLRKNPGVVCQGIVFPSNRLNLTDFTHIHFDFFIADTDLAGDVFNVKLVNFNGTGGETSALEVNINGGTTPQLVANQWVSVDVPITALGGVVANSLARNDVAEIGITTANVDYVWYDNIYLHKNTLATTSFKDSNVKLFPNPANTNFTIEANAAIEKVGVFNLLGQEVISQTPNSKSVNVSISDLQVGVYVVKTTIDGKVAATRIIKE